VPLATRHRWNEPAHMASLRPRVQAGLRMPSPARDGEQESQLTGQPGEICLTHGIRRRCGMQINRHIQVGRCFKERQEASIVKEKAFGRAVDQSARKTEPGDAAIEFSGGGICILQGNHGKAGETIWVGAHRVRQFIVHVMGQRCGRRHIERIEAHGGERENLQIDAGLVHVCDAAGAKVEQFGLHLGKPRSSCGAHERFGNEVLFKSNGTHEPLDAAVQPQIRQFRSFGDSIPMRNARSIESGEPGEQDNGRSSANNAIR